jgi:hypothetical protein
MRLSSILVIPSGFSGFGFKKAHFAPQVLIVDR